MNCSLGNFLSLIPMPFENIRHKAELSLDSARYGAFAGFGFVSLRCSSWLIARISSFLQKDPLTFLTSQSLQYCNIT